MDWVMNGEEFFRLRSALLEPVHGEVLELGMGTGLNLPHYPKAIMRLHAIDPAALLPKKVTERTARCSFPVQIQRVRAESLPYADRVFDCVVSTWTLCTVADPVQALREVERVLKPAGAFCFWNMAGATTAPRLSGRTGSILFKTSLAVGVTSIDKSTD
jgi:ubiquinone/menaquinone biosynthesis C-methylase UbiE